MGRILTLSVSFFLVARVFPLAHDPYELAVFGGEPSAMVGGCVSAITGDYFISENMLTIRGHEPIQIQSRYLSRKGTEKFAGWTHVLISTWKFWFVNVFLKEGLPYRDL